MVERKERNGAREEQRTEGEKERKVGGRRVAEAGGFCVDSRERK